MAGQTTGEPAVLRALRGVGALFLRMPRIAGVLLFVLWTGVIWRLSSLQAKEEESSFVMGWLVNSGHAPLFGFLAFLALVSLPRSEPFQTLGTTGTIRQWPRVSALGAAAILLAVLGYGLVDEWHQSLVPTRDASPWDVMTDMTGAACTLWIAAYLGDGAASAKGLAWRIAVGLALCLLAGLNAAT